MARCGRHCRNAHHLRRRTVDHHPLCRQRLGGVFDDASLSRPSAHGRDLVIGARVHAAAPSWRSARAAFQCRGLRLCPRDADPRRRAAPTHVALRPAQGHGGVALLVLRQALRNSLRAGPALFGLWRRYSQAVALGCLLKDFGRASVVRGNRRRNSGLDPRGGRRGSAARCIRTGRCVLPRSQWGDGDRHIHSPCRGHHCGPSGAHDAPAFSGTVRPGDPMHYQADISTARQWGWAPKHDLLSGVGAYAEWFRSGAL